MSISYFLAGIVSWYIDFNFLPLQVAVIFIHLYVNRGKAQYWLKTSYCDESLLFLVYHEKSLEHLRTLTTKSMRYF